MIALDAAKNRPGKNKRANKGPRFLQGNAYINGEKIEKKWIHTWRQGTVGVRTLRHARVSDIIPRYDVWSAKSTARLLVLYHVSVSARYTYYVL